MKRIILCCDGTWNRADQERNGAPCPTNVVKLALRIAKRDRSGKSQIVYYDQGVGTGNLVDHYSGGAFGHGLEENIHDAYRFLIGNYEPGDELYLFGFSRGAFTARSIAGMLRNCGILKRESAVSYREAVRLYRDPTLRPGHPVSREFRKRNSICGEGDVPIKCVGVWDTVGSLGIPLRGLRSFTRRKYQFHDTELSPSVEHAFHALAIDERRAPFEPAVWSNPPQEGQTIEQKWFCGVHSDVGGGYPESGLSDLALEWMIERARAAGLSFDPLVMQVHRTNGSFDGTLHDSRTGAYRISPGIRRRIDPRDPDALHPSVRDRWDEDDSYRPPNLRAYFAATADPRARS